MTMGSLSAALLFLAGCYAPFDGSARQVEIRCAIADPSVAPRDTPILAPLRSVSAKWQREFWRETVDPGLCTA